MSLTLSITEEQSFTALRSFLLEVLPDGVEVVQAQTNRVAPPQGEDYVTMTSMMKERISTNVDTSADALMIGSIVDTTMVITDTSFGSIGVGSPVFGVGVAMGTLVTQAGADVTVGGDPVTSDGTPVIAANVYSVNSAQTVPSRTLAGGVKQILMPTKMTVQLDVHGPSSGDNAVIITAAFRDSYAVELFQQSGFDVTPLYTSEARQLPFVNDSQQVEERWMLDVVMQINPQLQVPQQYASSVEIDLVEVDAVYPPT